MYRSRVINVLYKTRTTTASPRSLLHTKPNYSSPISRRLMLIGSGALTTVAFYSYLKPEHLSHFQFEPLLTESLPSSANYVDPTTSVEFPKTIQHSSSGKPMRLLGTGVRVVSFLNIRVYTVAFYVEEQALNDLENLPGWSGFDRSSFLPPYSDPKKSGENLLAELIKTSDCAIIITPLRNTTLAHLRDGFSRALVARMKLPSITSEWTETQASSAADSLSELKSLFPSRSLAKGGELRLWFECAKKGIGFEIKDPKTNKLDWLGNFSNTLLSPQLILSYFGDQNVPSPELQKSVAEGFELRGRR